MQHGDDKCNTCRRSKRVRIEGGFSLHCRHLSRSCNLARALPAATGSCGQEAAFYDPDPKLLLRLLQQVRLNTRDMAVGYLRVLKNLRNPELAADKSAVEWAISALTTMHNCGLIDAWSGSAAGGFWVSVNYERTYA